MNKTSFININELQTVSDISTNKLDRIHKNLWDNAVNKYFELNKENVIGDKSYYRYSEFNPNDTKYYEPTYVIAKSRQPYKIARNVNFQTYNFAYTYMFNNTTTYEPTYLCEIINDTRENVFIDLNKSKTELILNDYTYVSEKFYGKYSNKVLTEKLTYSLELNEEKNNIFSYSYTYMLSIETKNILYNFDSFTVFLGDFWNNEYYIINQINEIDKNLKYNLNGTDDEPSYFNVDEIDYVNGKVKLKDKFSSKTIKIGFNEYSTKNIF